MLRHGSPAPFGKARERFGFRREARKVEREFAAHDQLLQKFIRDEFVFGCIIADRQRDFERGNVTEVQIRAQNRSSRAGTVGWTPSHNDSVSVRGRSQIRFRAALAPPEKEIDGLMEWSIAHSAAAPGGRRFGPSIQRRLSLIGSSGFSQAGSSRRIFGRIV